MANLVVKFLVKNQILYKNRHCVAISRTCLRNASYNANSNAGYAKRIAEQKNRRLLLFIGGSAISLAVIVKMRSALQTVNASSSKKRMGHENDDVEEIKLTARERRFIKFASVEFDDQLYMSPQDFLDSVVEQEPRPRLKRRQLSSVEIDKYKEQTPALKKGSTRLFRDLREKGIISYTEYLFLLSILTKPKSGFRIAFNMFDTDGNQRVDKNEFLVIIAILAGAFRHIQNIDEKTRKLRQRLVPYKEELDNSLAQANEPPKLASLMERIFSGAWKEKHGDQTPPMASIDTTNENKAEPAAAESQYVNDKKGLQRCHSVSTTLQLHFFGKRGTGVLNFDNFYRFMDNLQTEVLELEFNEFSKGNRVISELDFAKILLRYTYLATDEYDVFLERLLLRIKEEKGITFDDFRDFCHFLNNLDDFTIAMRMYTLADRAISKEEFSRAVKICTGYNLSQHLIDTVFAIFDEDGDGLLSYKEFIAIMKDRLHRGFKSVAKSEGWDAFKYCVRQEMKLMKKSTNC